MRPLASAFFLFFVPGLVLGAAPSAKVSSQLRSERGSTGTGAEGIAGASSLTVSTDLNSGSALGAVALRLGHEGSKPSYERILLTDRQGNTRPLSDEFSGLENSLRGGLDLTLPAFTLSVDASRTLGKNAFPGYMMALQASSDRYQTGTRLLAGISRSDFLSPKSFYIDPDNFRTRERPMRLLETQGEAGVEQVLTETMKGRLQALFALRPNSRPMKAGLEGSFAWAFHDNKALVGTIGSAHELRGGSLSDERGYFDATWLQAELRWEPSFAWRLYGRVGTLLETETSRGRFARQRVGTDSLGFELRHTGGRIELGVNSLAAFSNTGYRKLQIGGNFVWIL